MTWVSLPSQRTARAGAEVDGGTVVLLEDADEAAHRWG